MKDGSAFLNDNAQRIIDGMIGNAERLRIAVSRGALGECLIDAGAKATGGVEAGLRMAEAAMGGLGSISVCMDRASEKWPLTIEVRSSQPVLACLGSQYAGWNLSSQGYFAMGS
ncbi:MAG: methenyltetrahydromethanopterin cyclohydrolase, partial [Mesorhizobium sp.]